MTIERNLEPSEIDVAYGDAVDLPSAEKPEKFEWPPYEKPDPEMVRRHRKRFIVRAMAALIHIGHAGYLEEAAAAIRAVQGMTPEESALVDEAMVEVQALLPRLTSETLERLDESQPDEPEECDVPAARAVLRAAAFPEAAMSDEDVQQLLDYRFLLRELKE